jgi:hypothetical protein
MYLTRENIEDIVAVTQRFPQCGVFELKESGQSGIGSILMLVVKTNVNGIEGKFETEISGVADW